MFAVNMFIAIYSLLDVRTTHIFKLSTRAKKIYSLALIIRSELIEEVLNYNIACAKTFERANRKKENLDS